MSSLPSDTLVTPGALVVSVSEARDHLNLWKGDGDDEPLLDTYLESAQRRVERDTFRSLSVQTFTKTQHCFPLSQYIPLRWGPLVSVESVQYIDPDGVTQTWDSANYMIDARQPGNLWRKSSVEWPATSSDPDSVTISYTAGLAHDDPMYHSARAAVLLLLAESYENRQPVGDMANPSSGRWSTYDHLRRQLNVGGWPGAYS